MGRHKLQNIYEVCLYVVIGHKMDGNGCTVYVIESIKGGVSKVVSSDNFKVIESHVNIDLVFSNNSPEESNGDKIAIQPALRSRARLKLNMTIFNYCHHQISSEYV